MCSRPVRGYSETLSQNEDEKMGVLIKNIIVLFKLNVKLIEMPLLASKVGLQRNDRFLGLLFILGFA